MHNLYVFLFYLIEDMELLFMFSFDARFKKGKKWICLGSLLATLLVTPVISIAINHFAVGTEPTPWWFYLSYLACILPIILWTEGNPFLNFLNMFVVGYVSIMLLDFFVGIVSGLFVKNAQMLRYEHDISALPNVLVFLLVALVESSLSLYIRFIWQRIVSRKWLANILFLVSLIPLSIIIFSDYYFENSLRAHIHLTNGVLGLIAFPLTLFVIMLIYFIKENKEHKKALSVLNERITETYEMHNQITGLVQKIGIWRHDIKNHLDVMNNLLDNNADNRQIKEIFTSTDRILGQSRELNITEYCLSPVLNSLLSSKQKKAKKEQINLQYQISHDLSPKISDYDLVSLSSNLLDNALEACLDLPAENRFVAFYLYEKKGYLCFDVMNSSAQRQEMQFNFRTTKENPKEHGYGMEIINGIAKKYHGYFEILPVTGDKHLMIPADNANYSIHSFVVLQNHMDN